MGTGDPAQEAQTDVKCGSELSVYITDKQSKSGKVTVALVPSQLPRRSWEDIIADGQTPYDGVVRRIMEFGALVDIGYDSLCFLPNAQVPNKSAANTFSIGQPLTVYAVQKRVSTGRVSLALERRARPLEPLEDVPCDGRSPYRGIIRSMNEFGIFVDFGCSVIGMLDEDHSDAALMQKQSSLRTGDVITVYPICKDVGNGRVYLSLKKREVPIRSVWELAADGQTPYLARVVSVHGKDCTMDLGADTRGLLTRSTLSTSPQEGFRELEIGDVVQVYIQRRNSTTGSLTLSLAPSPVRRISSEEILADLKRDSSKVYEGEVYCVQHGHIFLDIGSELGAVMPDTVPLPFICHVGDRVHVTLSQHDPRRGRLVAAPAEIQPPPSLESAGEAGKGIKSPKDGEVTAESSATVPTTSTSTWKEPHCAGDHRWKGLRLELAGAMTLCVSLCIHYRRKGVTLF